MPAQRELGLGPFQSFEPRVQTLSHALGLSDVYMFCGEGSRFEEIRVNHSETGSFFVAFLRSFNELCIVRPKETRDVDILP
jgi:hypothetical protein